MKSALSIAAALLLSPLVSAQVAPYSWRNVQIYGGGFVAASVFNRGQRGLMYARTDMGGAYRFNATDDSWAPLQDDLGLNNQSYWGTLSLATDATEPKRVYLATGLYTNSGAALAAVLYSDTYGSAGSWTAVTLPGVRLGGNEDGRSAGERLAIDHANNSHVYLGTSHAGLYTSSNYGRTWAVSASWPKSASLQSINFVLVDDTQAGKTPSIIFVGASTTSQSLYVSNNNGATWTPVPGAPSGLIPYRGALDRSARVVYFTYSDHVGPNGMTKGQVWKYTIATGAWANITPPTSVSPAGGGFAGVSVDAQKSGVVMVTTMDRWGPADGILRSIDGGVTWRDLVPSSVPHSDAPWVYWHRLPLVQGTGWDGDIAIDPFDSNTAIHTTGQGVWISHDINQSDTGAPTHWTFADRNLEETVPLELVAAPPTHPDKAILLSALGDIDGFVHTDLDKPSSFGMFSPSCGTNQGLDVAWLAPTHVVRTHNSNGKHGSFSTNGGWNYTFFPSEPQGAGQTPIGISADGAVIVWSAHWSADAGNTWAACTGLPAGDRGTASTPVADRVNPARMYATAGGSLYHSSDAGRSFTQGARAIPNVENAMRAVWNVEGHVWIPTSGGLYRTTDGGATATAVSGWGQGSALSVGVGAAAPGTSYAAIYVHGAYAGSTGIFRSIDEGATWTRINDWAHGFGFIMFITADPKTYGRVYVATNGRGAFVGDAAA